MCVYRWGPLLSHKTNSQSGFIVLLLEVHSTPETDDTETQEEVNETHTVHTNTAKKPADTAHPGWMSVEYTDPFKHWNTCVFVMF